MKTLIIPKKMSNSGNIYDLASNLYDREIKFKEGEKFAVILPSYYGGKGYTIHKSADSAIRQAKKLWKQGYNYEIKDFAGFSYSIMDGYWYSYLVRK